MIRGLLLFALILVAGNLAWVFGSPLVNNTLLEAKLEDLAGNRGLKSAGDLRADVMSFADEKKIPLKSTDLLVEIEGKKTMIAAHYRTEARFWFLNHTYDFLVASDPDAERKIELRKARNLIRSAS